MSSNIEEINSIEKSADRKELMISLFSNWDTTPIILEMEEEKFKKLGQPIRQLIIKILSKGIEDKHPIDNKPVRRRALSASEIMEVLNPKYKERFDGKEINKSNLYFHLNYLEDLGAIRVVEQIPTGKRYTSYYGRTAKVFYIKPDNSEKAKVKMEEQINKHSFLRSTELKELIYRMNPNVSKEEIIETINYAEGMNNYNMNLFKTWVTKYQTHTEGLDIDFLNLHAFLSILDRYNEKTVSGLIKIAGYLGMDKLD